MMVFCRKLMEHVSKNNFLREYSGDSAMSLLRGWKNAQKMEKIVAKDQKFDYFLVLDFEATCDNQTLLPAQEIIEFPVLKMSSKTWQIESTFHHYIKPLVCPRLSTFCTELTGIIQGQVDEQPTFPQVLQLFDQWMKKEGLVEGAYTFAFVTSGDWDLQTMLPSQCNLSNLPIPPYMHSWINIKKPFSTIMGTYPKGLMAMLTMLDLPLKGRQHSGIDDSHNIAEILKALAFKNYVFKLTESSK